MIISCDKIFFLHGIKIFVLVILDIFETGHYRGGGVYFSQKHLIFNICLNACNLIIGDDHDKRMPRVTVGRTR